MMRIVNQAGAVRQYCWRVGLLGLGGVGLIVGLLLVPLGSRGAEGLGQGATTPSDPFAGLRYRSIGPARGGRVTAVAGHRAQPQTYYFGATGGGVWKTTNAGQTWDPISDGAFETGSIGAIAVAESDPETLYVGTGSAAIRSNVIVGRGIYRSRDGGQTWQHVGLRRGGQIGSIRIHPRNPAIVYVAVLGQPFGANEERGVFRTQDGGETWEKVLYLNDQTGFVSLALNPANPDELYAGAWQAVRHPWTILSGGPSDVTGLYKTTDGGTTWTHLTQGLPTGLIGKVDIDLCASSPQHVYAILEADSGQGGVYRSSDSGATWKRVNATPALLARPFYYTYLDVDPKDPEKVWVNNLSLWRSTDGGRTFQTVSTPHGDNHGMWINPDNPDLIIQSNDGGANVSLDGGRSWSSIYNQPTAEIYQVAVDDQTPYRVYGAQQDNTTLILPSLPPTVEPVDDPAQLWQSGPGCETGPILPHLRNPRIIYGACKGEFYRMNLETGQTVSYWVHPQNRYGHNPQDIRYRFQRVSPLEVSPHDPNIIYHASHVVHRTRDEGVTWEVISPDLTANDPARQVISGGPITRDITGEEVYSTIYALRESPLEPGVLWAGANDGPVHVSRDHGKTWRQVTPAGLPPGGRVQNIEPSPHRKGSAYLAIYRYLLDDWQPYLYLTNDYGATWRRLTDGQNGIPADTPTRVVREDPSREGLLYAGTEFGMYVSFDQGGRWQRFQRNLPVTPVTDLRVHRRDLVVSTMGRGFWILDDLTPLHHWQHPAVANRRVPAAPRLVPPREAIRMRYPSMGGRPEVPEYPSPAATIDYWLPTTSPKEVTLEILDREGRPIHREISRPAVTDPAPGQGMRAPARSGPVTRGLTARPGHNRYRWDLRIDDGAGGGTGRSLPGPLAVPGRYSVRLSVDGWQQAETLTIVPDPRLAADGVIQADLEEQLALSLAIRATTREARTLVEQIENRLRSVPDSQKGPWQSLRARLVTAPGAYPQPMLIDQLASLSRMVNSADRKVGRSAFDFHDELRQALRGLEAEVAAMVGGTPQR
jgi:photosystem II stability/assembly factor-like uncharacterized protein